MTHASAPAGPAAGRPGQPTWPHLVATLLGGEDLPREHAAWAMEQVMTASATATGSSGCGTTRSARDHVASQASAGRPMSTSTGGHR